MIVSFLNIDYVTYEVCNLKLLRIYTFVLYIIGDDNYLTDFGIELPNIY